MLTCQLCHLSLSGKHDFTCLFIIPGILCIKNLWLFIHFRKMQNGKRKLLKKTEHCAYYLLGIVAANIFNHSTRWLHNILLHEYNTIYTTNVMPSRIYLILVSDIINSAARSPCQFLFTYLKRRIVKSRCMHSLFFP